LLKSRSPTFGEERKFSASGTSTYCGMTNPPAFGGTFDSMGNFYGFTDAGLCRQQLP
jgi:hypothetical protein